VGLACSIRPINAIIWVYMLGTLCWHLRFQSRALVSVVLSIVKIGSACVHPITLLAYQIHGVEFRLLSLLTIFCLDSFYYSKVTFTPLHFLLTNLSSVSLFYGSSPWHYYVSQALPILCTTSLPFILHGAWLAFSNRKTNASDTKLRVLLGCVGWTIGVYSMTGHKEWRFLHPLLPLLHVLSSKSLVDAHDCRLPTRKSTANTGAKPLLPIRTSHLGFILCTVPASVYVVFFHCSAQISVMSYLRSVPSHDLSSVGFLMPCHSTPWQAYLHRPELAVPGRLWALGCEPPLG
jgi:GPI mannosyltransferase 3